MKRITAIAIAAAAVLGCSYVGEAGAVSCAVGIKNIQIQRNLGMYDTLPFDASMSQIMKDACKLGNRYKTGGMSQAAYDSMRAGVLQAVASNDRADDVAKAQLVSIVSDLLDVGYFGQVVDRK